MRSLEEENPIEMKYINDLLHNNEYQPCFYNVGSYATAFLYFIETDTTIGTYLLNIKLETNFSSLRKSQETKQIRENPRKF